MQLSPPLGLLIVLGTGITEAEPGSVQGVQLCVNDIDAAAPSRRPRRRRHRDRGASVGSLRRLRHPDGNSGRSRRSPLVPSGLPLLAAGARSVPWPPEMAARIDSSAPGSITVARPSRERTSSSPTNRLTWVRSAPCSSRIRRSSAGWARATASRTCATVVGCGKRERQRSSPPHRLRSAPGTVPHGGLGVGCAHGRVLPARRGSAAGGRREIATSRRRRPIRRPRRFGCRSRGRRVVTVGGGTVPEHREVRVVLRQALGQRAPRRAGVGGAPDRATPVGRAPVLGALQRQQVGGVGRVGSATTGKPKSTPPIDRMGSHVSPPSSLR